MNQMMIRVFGGGGPVPCVLEGHDLRLAVYPVLVFEKHIIVTARIKWRVKVHEIVLMVE